MCRLRRLLPFLLLLPSPLLAQNLFPGGNFDDDEGVAGWQAATGSLFHATEDESSCPNSGSLEALCAEIIPSALWELDATGPCTPVAPGGLLVVSWSYQGSGGSAPGFVAYYLEAFDNPSCAGGPVATLGFQTFEIFPWVPFQGSLPVPPGGAFRMRLDGAALDGCVADLDRIEVTFDDHVFLDDLDGGATCRWSTTAGD